MAQLIARTCLARNDLAMVSGDLGSCFHDHLRAGTVKVTEKCIRQV